MHLLLTRPKSDDDPLPELLRARGHTSVHDPLLRIDFLPLPIIDAANLQAIVVTSSNALRAIAGTKALTDLLHIPLYTVGIATANYSKTLGFSRIFPGNSSVSPMILPLLSRIETGWGPVLYLRGEDVAFDLGKPLRDAGHEVQEAVVYRAVAAKAFAAETIAGLARGAITGVVLMSPRTAETYVHLAETAGLVSELSFLPHYCLSERVAAPLGELADVHVRTPKRPNLQELVALIDLDATQS